MWFARIRSVGDVWEELRERLKSGERRNKEGRDRRSTVQLGCRVQGAVELLAAFHAGQCE